MNSLITVSSKSIKLLLDYWIAGYTAAITLKFAECAFRHFVKMSKNGLTWHFNQMSLHSMYAIAFDLVVDDLKRNYGEPYNGAYDEIRREMESVGFEWKQGSVYIASNNANLTTVYKAIDRLRTIDWFKKSVRDIRAFKVEDWSDFTEIVRGA